MNINKAIIIKSIMLVVLFIAVFTSFPNFAFIVIDWLTSIVQTRVELDIMLNDFWRGLKS